MAKREQPHIIHYLLQIDKAIRNNEYPNSTTFINDWGISRSTFNRYLNILKDSYDAPIEFDSQRNGFYYSDKTFFIKNVMLKEGELLTISTLIPFMEQYKNTPLEAPFNNIISKITEMLPENISIDSSFINNEIHFISEPIAHIKDGVFDAVLNATKLHKQLKLQYKTAKNDVFQERIFDPYHLICQKGNWYVLGFSHYSNDIRIYAMPRINEVKITDVSFSLPADFKLEKYIDPEFGIWQSKTGEVIKIELLFDKSMKAYISEREWHKTQKLEIRPDGSVYLAFDTNQIDEVARWILHFAGTVKVLNPPSLNALVKEYARKILEK